MTTASGTREVPFARPHVWRALTAPTPYCPVCDVSYVFSETTDDGGAATIGEGTRFVCAPGRLDGAPPPPNAVSGEIVEWVTQRRVGTRLELTPETWQTRIELADAERGSTQVTVTVTREPKGGIRLLHALQRKATQRLVQRTVDSELAKLPDHIRRAVEDHDGPVAAEQGSISVEQEADGWVLHLRGQVDAPAVNRLELQRRLEELTVVAIDVRELSYLDSTALPFLLRWGRRSSQAGHRPVIRGANPAFDQLLGVMGLTSIFPRDD